LRSYNHRIKVDRKSCRVFEYYKELNKKAGQARDIEQDAVTPDEVEKHYG